MGGELGREKMRGLDWPELKLWRRTEDGCNDAGCDRVDLSLSLAASSRSQRACLGDAFICGSRRLAVCLSSGIFSGLDQIHPSSHRSVDQSIEPVIN